MVEKSGDLEIGDRTKLYFRALRTSTPLQFAWRTYVPPGSLSYYSSAGTNLYGINPSEGKESIFRVAFRVDRGRLLSYIKTSGGVSMTSLGDPELVNFLRDRWGQLLVEQAGQPELLAADHTKPLTLLRLTLPPAMAQEARTKLSTQSQQYLRNLNGNAPMLFELKIP